jgi:hypothetical protein
VFDGKSAMTPFIVLYRWRLYAGCEASFVETWSRVSDKLRSDHASLGSRLHRGNDGLWYSYAQWPTAAARADAFAKGSIDPQASAAMNRCIAEDFPEIVLECAADFLLSLPQREKK